MNRSRSIVAVLGWMAAVLAFFPSKGHALQYSGLISIENYYSADSDSVYKFDFLTTRLRLDASDLDGDGQLSFHFSGRERLRLSSSDYSSDIRNERIDILNVEYDRIGGHLDVLAGRLVPKEFGAERVDGMNLVYHLGNGGVGAFGGLRPDPYDEMFSRDFSIAGGYLFYRTQPLTASLGFTHQIFDGETDRRYVYGQMIYNPFKVLRLFASGTVDIAQDTKDLRLSNLLTEVSLRPHDRLQLAVGYNQFRSVEFFSSMDFEINTTRQQTYFARGDFRLLEGSSLFGRVERRTLDYPSFETKTLNSDMVQGGFQSGQLLFADIRLEATASFTDSYSSKYRVYDLELSRLNWNMLQISVGGSYAENEYDLTGSTDTLWTYTGSLDLYLKKSWTLSLFYQRIEAETYRTDTGMARLAYRFKSAKKQPPPAP